MKSAEFAETYDIDKDAEMTLDIAETILAAFGISRIQFGSHLTGPNSQPQ